MVRTRRQLKNKENNQESRSPLETDAKTFNNWDVPGLNGKTLKATIITTYSRKRPQKMTPLTRSDFEPGNPRSPVITHLGVDLPEKCLKSGQTRESTQKMSGKRKHQPDNFSEPSRKKHFSYAPRSSCKKTNKTTVSVGSMVAGTMVDMNGDFDDESTVPMSLCSMVDGTEVHYVDNQMVHNSTVDIANQCNIGNIVDYVPADISIIKGDEEQKLYLSFRNELTPAQQKTGNGIQKRVQFSFGRTDKTTKVHDNNRAPNARRSILKTPHKKSPRPKEKSTLQTETMVTNFCQSNGIPTDGVGIDTEQLLEFEPLPLQCSDDVYNLSESNITHRDITPETPNSAKKHSGSGKESRRLIYPPHKEDPSCLLLDFPTHKDKKALILCGKDQLQLSVKEMQTLFTDVLC